MLEPLGPWPKSFQWGHLRHTWETFSGGMSFFSGCRPSNPEVSFQVLQIHRIVDEEMLFCKVADGRPVVLIGKHPGVERLSVHDAEIMSNHDLLTLEVTERMA